jgi:uncharacterized membrane protein
VIGTIVLSLASFGIFRIVSATWVLAHGGNHDFGGLFTYPGWAAVHFVAAGVFVVLLPFQLWPASRAVYPHLHRVVGRMAAAAGASFAVSGIVLPFAMPNRPFSVRAFMALVGVAFVFLLYRGVRAIRGGDVAAHRRWMLRVTAAALAPLTERLIFPLLASAGIDSVPRFWDLFVTALWFSAALNVVVVEWWLQRGAFATSSSTSAWQGSSSGHQHARSLPRSSRAAAALSSGVASR